MYSPTIGRFLQTDPIGYDDGMNLYRYVGNDPVNMIDPDGLQTTIVVTGQRDPCALVSTCDLTGNTGQGLVLENILPIDFNLEDILNPLIVVNGRQYGPQDEEQILGDICEVGQAIETLGAAGADVGVVVTIVGLAYPPVAAKGAVFTELSGITEAGGQLVQDLTQGDIQAGFARAGYGIAGGKVLSAVVRNYGRVSSYLNDSELNARDTLAEAYLDKVLDSLPGVDGTFNPEIQCRKR